MARFPQFASVMVFQIQSATLLALQVQPVLVEVSLSLQLPQFTLVGLASPLTQESRERVRAAIQNSDLPWPQRRITVNLVPSHLPKWGSQLELAMALAIVLGGPTYAQISTQFNGKIFALGELSLAGELRSCGMGSFIRASSSQVLTQVFSRASIIVGPREDMDILQRFCHLQSGQQKGAPTFLMANSLQEAVDGIMKAPLIAQSDLSRDEVMPFFREESQEHSKVKNAVKRIQILSQVKDEPLAVLAAIIALKAKKHILLMGPQGSGKSMIARGIEEARDDWNESEEQDNAMIAQAFGAQRTGSSRQRRRACVRLQSSMTREALEGSISRDGSAIPGELSRAHGGYAIMDEFLEFRRDVLEILRLPLEEGKVRLQRARFRTELPACFQLVATTNLCPCGSLGSERRTCRCTRQSLAQYHRKLSGPIIDRFDLAVLLGTGQDLQTYLRAQGLCGENEKKVIQIIQELLAHMHQICFAQPSGELPAENDPEILETMENHRPGLLHLSRRGQDKVLRLASFIAEMHSSTRSKADAANAPQTEDFLHYLNLAKILRTDVEKILS